ncbi:hypothetical protein CBS101457_006557 [Exobasidium rhododendri]|nr:hypothetical protein CBS101457_006557 [Exobasidium rhododendri]
MPRAVTRAVSSSFSNAPYSHAQGSSSLKLSSSKAPSILDMYPSPRPSKASHSSSKFNILSSSFSSPSNSKGTAVPAPHTPPPLDKASKKAKTGYDAKPAKTWEEQIETCLQGYQIEMDKELLKARQALEMSIISARAQMEVGILVYPRSVLMTKVEDFINQKSSADSSMTAKYDKASHDQAIAPAPSSKRPRIAKPGEVVYSARGSPILLQRLFDAGEVTISDDEDDENGEEPSFDTAGDDSIRSESFSLPDVAAITAEVEKEHNRNKILSSEGYQPRSSTSGRFPHSNRSSSR